MPTPETVLGVVVVALILALFFWPKSYDIHLGDIVRMRGQLYRIAVIVHDHTWVTVVPVTLTRGPHSGYVSTGQWREFKRSELEKEAKLVQSSKTLLQRVLA